MPSQLAELTGLHVLSLHDNQLTGTIPSQLAELTGLTKLWLGRDLLTGTIPPQLAKLTRVTDLELYSNQLTGAVPSLPFKQYRSNCCLYYDQHTNNFTCPLPAGAAECKCNGRPGVPACNMPV
jgi:Leucine-rich repeat (LRR) protein